MKVIAIRNMSADNSETGEAWLETKVFDGHETLQDVMQWVGYKKRVQLSVPEGEEIPTGF